MDDKSLDSTNQHATPTDGVGITRRATVRAAAWAVPTVALAVAAPAATASTSTAPSITAQQANYWTWVSRLDSYSQNRASFDLGMVRAKYTLQDSQMATLTSVSFVSATIRLLDGQTLTGTVRPGNSATRVTSATEKKFQGHEYLYFDNVYYPDGEYGWGQNPHPRLTKTPQYPVSITAVFSFTGKTASGATTTSTAAYTSSPIDSTSESNGRVVNGGVGVFPYTTEVHQYFYTN